MINSLKTGLLASLLLLHLGGLQAQKQNKKATGGYTITGKVKNASGKVYLEEMTSANSFQKRDSAQLTADGSFTMKGQVPAPGLYRLLFEKNQAMLIPLENKALEVGGDLSNLTATAYSKGTTESEVLQKMRGIRNYTQNQTQRINERYGANQANADSVNAIMLEYQRLVAREATNLKSLISSNPASNVGVYIAMSVLSPENHLEFTDSMAQVYKKRMPNSAYVSMLEGKVKQFKSVAPGSIAPDIKLQNPDGQTIALSSLRGKYVLIDFWASWCGPCRQENPNVVKLYNTYKNKNFEIYGVSLDQNKDKWLKAIKDDNLTWTHVSDLKYWQSAGAQLYNVNSIPATVLLDPQGRIIAKNLRGQALEEKLASLLGNNK